MQIQATRNVLGAWTGHCACTLTLMALAAAATAADDPGGYATSRGDGLIDAWLTTLGRGEGSSAALDLRSFPR